MKKLVRKDILYPELSYQIIGILFEVSNALGYKYQERYYQRTVSIFLKNAGIRYKEQVPVVLLIGGKPVTKGFIDFLIEDKIILELKKGERFLRSNIDQVYSYLSLTNLELGILANFTKQGLQFKRILNIRNSA